MVEEIAQRLGIKSLIDNASESNKLKAYFGVTKKSEVQKRLRARMTEFYERRNGIVHSLSGTTGYAVDVVIDYIKMFEMTAEAIVVVLKRETASW